MRIEVDVFGDKQLSRELLRFSDRADDASPAFRQIAGLLRDAERQQFISQGKYASDGWEKLADVTRRAKARNPNAKYKRAILRVTGALMDSFTKQRDRGHIEDIEPDALVFGSRVPYARFHQLGTRNMPRRRPLELRARDRTAVVKTLQAWIVQGDA